MLIISFSVPAPKKKKKEKKLSTTQVIILGTVAGFTLTLILIAIIITCRQMRVENRQRRRAIKYAQRNAMELKKLLNYNSPHTSPNHNQESEHTVIPQTAISRFIPAQTGNGTYMNHTQAVPTTKVNTGSNHRTPHKQCQGEAVEILYDHVTDQSKRKLSQHRKYNKEDAARNYVTSGKAPDAVVTVETPPLPRRLAAEHHARDRSPSPRPDVIQEERQFTYPLPSYASLPGRNSKGHVTRSDSRESRPPMGIKTPPYATVRATPKTPRLKQNHHPVWW